MDHPPVLIENTEELQDAGTHCQWNKSRSGTDDDSTLTEDTAPFSVPNVASRLEGLHISVHRDSKTAVTEDDTTVTDVVVYQARVVSDLSRDKVPPPPLRELIAKNLGGLAEYQRSHPTLNLPFLERELSALRRKLRDSQTEKESTEIRRWISDKWWCINNIERLVLVEQALQHPELVQELRRVEGDGWHGRIWCANSTILETDLQDKYVRSILTHTAYLDERYRVGGWASVQKYDLKKKLNTTQFDSIEFIDGQITVMDYSGAGTTVSMNWAKQHIPRDTLDNAKKTGVRCHLPVGSRGRIIYWRPQTNSSPPVRYQNQTNIDGMCLVSSFTSALCHIGFSEEAEEILSLYSKTPCLGQRQRQMKVFLDAVMKTFKAKEESYGRVRMRHKHRERFNPLRRDNPLELPVVAVIKAHHIGKNGKMSTVGLNHGVSFVGGYMFDSNLPFALDITRESLDRVCSNVVEGSKYKGIYWDRALSLGGAKK